MRGARSGVEWPTLAMLGICYGAWGVAVLSGGALWWALPLAALAIALHGSLQHEAMHGHPTRHKGLNAALVWPALGLVIPWGRYRDTHLAHHRNPELTDPHEDPESNYLDPADWARLPRPARWALELNRTLLGRLLLGPALGLWRFAAGDWRQRRDPAIRRAWAAHLPAAGMVLALVVWAPMPLTPYLAAAYAGLSLQRLRSFLEHRAHERHGARTVIVEDRGPLAWLFLNNNLHVVHHMHPDLPWYALPARYAARPAHYRRVNGGYVYRSYAQIFRAYLLRPKDPVPHPLRAGAGGAAAPSSSVPAPASASARSAA